MGVHIVLGAPLDSEPLDFDYQEGDHIIGVDRGALHLLEAHYPLDIALGDFDSIKNNHLDQIKQLAKRVINKDDQDNTDFELALEVAINQYPDEQIYVYNWKGGRLDHQMSILYVCYQDRFQSLIDKLHLVHPDNTVAFYQPGTYQLHKEADKTYLSFINMSPMEKLTLEGVKYPLKDTNLDHPYALISNEFKDAQMTLSFESGLMMVIQSKDKD